MKANNMSDEELDKLFRAAAENIDPAFDPQAWEAMTQKLDQNRQAWLRRLFTTLMFLFALMLLTVSDLSEHPDQNGSLEANKVSMDRSLALRTNNPLKEDSAVVAKSTDEVVEATAIPSKKQYSSNTTMHPKQQVFTQQPATYSKARKIRPKAAVVRASKEKQIVQQVQISEANFPGLSNKKNTPLLDTVATDQKKHSLKVHWHEDKADKKAGEDSISTQLPKQQETVLKAANNDTLMEEPKRAFLKNIQVALLLGPDITTVEFKDWNAISVNAGVGLAVPLTQRISIITGALWANKLYSAAPEDYAPGSDYWYGRKIPDAISARCQVIDIPLDIRYQVIKKGKDALALQAGFSSYLMQKEKYTYHYQYGVYGTYNSSWHVVDQNKHWFSVQNLSVSYTHELTPALTLGTQPFAKIPLAGIGAGKVKLISVGVLFSASYTMNFIK